MKNKALPILAAFFVLFLSACDKDPYLLELTTYDVRWFDSDQSKTQTGDDVLTFDIEVNTTARDSDDQFIEEWEFSYFVNGQFMEVLRGDDRLRTNSINFSAEVAIGNLALPFNGPLLQGDVVEFRLWVIDNQGMEVEQTHRYVIEE